MRKLVCHFEFEIGDEVKTQDLDDLMDGKRIENAIVQAIDHLDIGIGISHYKVDEEFSTFRYTIEAMFLDKLKKCMWWQIRKRKSVYKWREEKLKRYNKSYM